MNLWYPPAITTGVPATKQPPPPPPPPETHVPPEQTWPDGQSVLEQHCAQVPLQHFWLDTQQTETQTLAFAQHVPPT
jgi:hypothetical protein